MIEHSDITVVEDDFTYIDRVFIGENGDVEGISYAYLPKDGERATLSITAYSKGGDSDIVIHQPKSNLHSQLWWRLGSRLESELYEILVSTAQNEEHVSLIKAFVQGQAKRIQRETCLKHMDKDHAFSLPEMRLKHIGKDHVFSLPQGGYFVYRRDSFVLFFQDDDTIWAIEPQPSQYDVWCTPRQVTHEDTVDGVKVSDIEQACQ